MPVCLPPIHDEGMVEYARLDCYVWNDAEIALALSRHVLEITDHGAGQDSSVLTA